MIQKYLIEFFQNKIKLMNLYSINAFQKTQSLFNPLFINYLNKIESVDLINFNLVLKLSY